MTLTEMQVERTLLQLRDAIAAKEFWTASANRDLKYYGDWQCDYSRLHKEADERVQKIEQFLSSLQFKLAGGK